MNRIFCDRCKKEIAIPRLADGSFSDDPKLPLVFLATEHAEKSDEANYRIEVQTEIYRPRRRRRYGMARTMKCDLCPGCIAFLIGKSKKESE